MPSNATTFFPPLSFSLQWPTSLFDTGSHLVLGDFELSVEIAGMYPSGLVRVRQALYQLSDILSLLLQAPLCFFLFLSFSFLAVEL